MNYIADDGPSSVAIGDLNRDSDPDLAVANEWSDNFSVLINIGQVADADTGGGVRGVIPDKMSY
ncbi:MAG: FG-GAP repeat protein [Deltaproteobacteria bacterium]|nr:FG-GAP repeat protein [Deltaproteobacteria bacterium]